jgi:hypothetical protein
VCRVGFWSVCIDWLVVVWIFHDSDGLIIGGVLIGLRGWFGGGLWIGRVVVVFLLDVPLWSVVSFILGPGEGEGAGTSRSLYYFFVSLPIEVSVVSNVFIDHLRLFYKMSKLYLSNFLLPLIQCRIL